MKIARTVLKGRCPVVIRASTLTQLPLELTKEVDDTVRKILENSENGIPELALEAICDRCGCDWYEELDKWLKL